MNKNTAMFKGAAFNQIRKVLRPNGHKGEPSTLTVEEQFKAIVDIINLTSANLRYERFERKRKAKIAQERKDRGYVPKKKTSKEEYLKMLKEVTA